MKLKVIKKNIWRLKRILYSRLGYNSKLVSPDRVFQEATLFPKALENKDNPEVLYVGVSWYTYHYYKKYLSKTNLVTLDILPEQAVFGCKNHLVGGLDHPDLLQHKKFDLIFMIGVLGYGVNDFSLLKEVMVNVDKIMKASGCCYLTIEVPSHSNDKVNLDVEGVTRFVESMGCLIYPVSEWMEMLGDHGKNRYFVMARSKALLEIEVDKFSN